MAGTQATGVRPVAARGWPEAPSASGMQRTAGYASRSRRYSHAPGTCGCGWDPAQKPVGRPAPRPETAATPRPRQEPRSPAEPQPRHRPRAGTILLASGSCDTGARGRGAARWPSSRDSRPTTEAAAAKGPVRVT